MKKNRRFKPNKYIETSQIRMVSSGVKKGIDDETKRKLGNTFSVLDLSSDSEGEEQREKGNDVKEEKKGVVRDWKIEVTQETGALFSKNKKRKSGRKKEEDGWTSIAWKRPQFMTEDDEIKIKEEKLEEVIRTTPESSEEECKKEVQEHHKTTQLAKEWAAKIRQSLEKAEASGAEPKAKKAELSDEFIASLGKLSFFRKPFPSEIH